MRIATLGLVWGVVGIAVVASASTASAAKMRYTEVPNRDACWVVEYVPRTVEANTRGKLIRGERVAWSGNYVDGGLIRRDRLPAVYEKTVRVVEEEHYTLTKTACALRPR